MVRLEKMTLKFIWKIKYAKIDKKNMKQEKVKKRLALPDIRT